MLDCQLFADQGVTFFPRGDALVTQIILRNRRRMGRGDMFLLSFLTLARDPTGPGVGFLVPRKVW